MRARTAPSPHTAPYRLAGGVFLAVILLYLSFPAARYNFDGVACAIAIDTGDLKHLLHGNHLAYGFLGYLFSGLFQQVGIPLPGIFSLQIFSSLLGAGAVSLFSLLLLECKVEPLVAVLGALGLALSRIFWIWSLEAQTYPLGAFFIIWTAYEAFRPNPRPGRLGLLHAGAILGHVGHLMFLPAALYLLRSHRQRFLYLTTLIAGVIAAYVAAAFFIMKPGSLNEWRIWLLGSAALKVDRSFGWHGGYSWNGFKDWARISLQMASGGFLGGLVLIVAAVAGAKSQWESKTRAVRACLLWLIGYAVLFLSWEPYTLVYRITDLVPLWILAIFGFEIIPGKRQIKIATLAAYMAILGLWNFRQEILPASNSDNNVNLQRVLWVARETPENAWIIVDSVDQVYIPYFAHRRPINLRYYQDKEPELLQRVSGLEKTGEPVFFVPQAITSVWRESLAKSSIVVTRSGELELRRVVSKQALHAKP